MLSLSQPTAPRCLANSSRRAAAMRPLRVCAATCATVPATPAVTSSTSARSRRAGCGNFNLRQRSARRVLLRPLAAVPGDRQPGAHPESGTGSSGAGREPEARRTPGSQQGSNVGAAPEAGTRPEYDVTSGMSAGGGTSGMSGGEVHSQSSGSGGSGRASDDYTAATGGLAPSSEQSPALNQRTRVARTDDMTGTMPGGPQDVLMGQGVPSSDTHPEMDPSESRMYAEREGQGSGSLKEQFVSSSSKGQKGRDESDKQSEPGHADSGGSSTRAHPAARTAATAIGSAAGTVLGAVGGPVGAAAGAAIGGGMGRNIADALGGHKEQAEIYDQGAEPEQVAEEAMAAGDAALRATGYVAEDVRAAASKAKAAASDLVDRASERLSDSSTSGGSSSSTAGDIRDRARADLDADRAGQADVQGGIGSSVEYKSGDKDSNKHDRSSHGHKGVVGQVKDSVAGAARSAVDKVSSATEGIPFPTFPPETGKEDDMYASKAGSFVGEGDTAVERGAAAVGDRLQGAAKAAVDKVASAAEGLEFPTFPPATGNEDDMYASKAGSFVGEGDTAVERGAAAAGDRLQGAAKSLRASVSDTARTAADNMPSGEDVRDTAHSTARAAADYGSPETSQRLTEMTNQSEFMLSQQAGGTGQVSRAGIDREGSGWSMRDRVEESGYYAYRSVDDFGSVRDPLHARRLRSSSSSSSRSGRSSSPEMPPPPAAAAAAAAGRAQSLTHASGSGGLFGAGEGRGGDRAGAGAAAAAEGLEGSEARAAEVGWGDADQNKEWGGVGDWTTAEAAVKSAVGTPMDRRDAPSMMQSDNMDLTQMVSATSPGGGAGVTDLSAGGSAQAAGGYGGGNAGDFDVDSAREMGGELGGSNAELMSARNQDRDRGSYSASGRTAGGATGVAAVDEGLPEGTLAAGGPDAHAAMGVERGESSSETTSDSTAERVAQVYGVPPEASTGKEEADTYRAEADQEGSS